MGVIRVYHEICHSCKKKFEFEEKSKVQVYRCLLHFNTCYIKTTQESPLYSSLLSQDVSLSDIDKHAKPRMCPLNPCSLPGKERNTRMMKYKEMTVHIITKHGLTVPIWESYSLTHPITRNSPSPYIFPVNGPLLKTVKTFQANGEMQSSLPSKYQWVDRKGNMIKKENLERPGEREIFIRFIFKNAIVPDTIPYMDMNVWQFG